MFNSQELYEFSSRVRRRFASKLQELPWDKVIQNREASFYSMRNILIHMIDNEDWIVNWVIQNRSLEYKPAKKPEDYADMKQVIEHLDEIEAKTRSYFKNIEGEQGRESKRRINFVLRSSGKSFDLSVEEALLQTFTEQIYHLGELIALFWQENVEPPPMQWFWNNPRQPDSK